MYVGSDNEMIGCVLSSTRYEYIVCLTSQNYHIITDIIVGSDNEMIGCILSSMNPLFALHHRTITLLLTSLLVQIMK